jgi:hypothetical protein
MWILFRVPCPTPDGRTAQGFYALAEWATRAGASAFFQEWDTQHEPGEVAVRLEGEVGLVPLRAARG